MLNNYQAEAVLCSSKNGQPTNCGTELVKGKWTAIYDQALNIELNNGFRLLSNLRYNLKQDIAKDPFSIAQQDGIGAFQAIETSDYEKFDSECARTMVGFVQNLPGVSGKSMSMKGHEVRCFHGAQ